MSSQNIFDILNMYAPPTSRWNSSPLHTFYSCEISKKGWTCKKGSVVSNGVVYSFLVPENAVRSTLEARLASIPVTIE